MRCSPPVDSASILPLPAGPPPVTKGRRRHYAAPKFPLMQPPCPSSPSNCRSFLRQNSALPKFLGWHSGSGLPQDGESLPQMLSPSPCTFSEGFTRSPQPGFLPKLPSKAAAAAGPRAMWSDDHELRSSDGFNMRKWRAEFADELARARKFPTRHLAKCNANDAAVLQAKAVRRREASPTLPSLSGVQATAEDYYALQDPMLSSAIIRDDVGSGLALREICAKENAKRRRQLIDDAGRTQRRVAAHRRAVLHCQVHQRSVVMQEEEEIPEGEDSDVLAKEERVQQTIARIQCRRSGEALSPPIDSSSATKMSKALRSRVKHAVTWRLEQRRKQAKKRLALKENRLARINALPESERRMLQDSFLMYSKEVKSRKMVQVLDLPKCLMEAGLSGTNCLERWRVDRVCKEMVFALTLEYSNIEKIPPIGAFRGSLIPRAVRSAHRCNSLQDVAGPSLEKLRSDEDDHPTLSASDEKEECWRESFAKVVANSESFEDGSSDEEDEQPDISKTQSCRSNPSANALSSAKRSSIQAFSRSNTLAFSIAEEEPHCGDDGEARIPSCVERARKRQSLSMFSKPEEKQLKHRRLEGASETSVSNGMANVEAKLWRSSVPDQKISPLRRVLVHATQSLMTARKFMLSRPISFEDFAAEVVPAVRAELMEIRQDVHFDEFMQVLGVSESGGTVCLSEEQCERLATRLHIEREVFERIFATLPEADPVLAKEDTSDAVEVASRLSKESKDSLLGLIPRFQGHKDDEETISSRSKVDPRLTFETVHEMLVKMEEFCELEKRATERRIMERTGMTASKFWEHRSELIRLYDYFELYDSDQSRCLCQKEVKQLLKHVGLQPYKKEEGELVTAWFEEAETDGHRGLSFSDFLDLMEKVREYQKRQRQKMLRIYFRKYSDGHQRMDIAVVEKALMDAGISGNTTMEQDLQQRIIYDWDVDNSGDIVFEEFSDMCQRIQERLQGRKMEEILRYASSLGIEKQRLSEYIYAYDQYDADHNGGLSTDEIGEVLRKWCPLRAPTADELQELFDRVGIKSNQEVPLTQFLDIMQIASVGRGMFARELPFTLRDVSLDKLREILSVFSLGKNFIDGMDHSGLLELVSSYLEVKLDANLREELEAPTPVGSEKLLIDYARRLQKQMRPPEEASQSLGQALNASLSE